MSKNKFNLGQNVTYTNKRNKTDLSGVIIGYDEEYFVIEPYHGVYDREHFSVKSLTKFSWSHSEVLAGYWDKLPNSSRSYRTKSANCLYVPKRSKNLQPAWTEYDPTQAGDREDDV